MICQDFYGSRTRIILFMAFEVASHLVTCVSNTTLPEQPRIHIYTILQQSWLICTRCHVRLVGRINPLALISHYAPIKLILYLFNEPY
jgi:hypothetical protein